MSMQITGIVVYEDLEGGFWGIVTGDGDRYEIANELPAAVREPGCMIKADIEPAGTVSIRQWGRPVKILSAEKT